MTEEELFQFCVCEVGITPFEYYDLSPREIDIIAKGKIKKQRDNFEMLRKIVLFGVAGALKGKDQPLFDTDDAKVIEITKQDREETLNMLNDIFGSEVN